MSSWHRRKRSAASNLAGVTLGIGLCVVQGSEALAQCAGTWSPLGTGANGEVAALTVDPTSGVVIAGGFFTAAGGVNAKNIAQWTPGATLGTGAWSALGAGVGVGGEYVMSLATLANGDVAVGGSFASAGGVAASDIARWDGSTWSALGPGVNSYVRAIHALPSGGLVAGGAFWTTGVPGGTGGITLNDVALWDAASGWQPMGTGTDTVVTALDAFPGGDIVAGGAFFHAGGVPANSVARWSLGGWSALPPGMYNQFVWAVAVMPNGDIVAGGEFGTVGTASIVGIARWDGSTWNAMGPAGTGPVYALTLLPGGDLVAGGSFTSAGGVPASRIARWNGTTWNAMGSGTNGTVEALAVLPGGDVVAGGIFSVAGGQVCANIARWTPSTPISFQSQPADASVCATGSAVFSVSASGPGSLAYQWQVSSGASPGVWTNLTVNPTAFPCGGWASADAPDASQATVTIAPCPGLGSYQVRCVVSNSCGSTSSNAAAYSVCYANCDCSTVTPALNANDFQCFLNGFAGGNPYANCDGSSVSPVLNANDFQCFLNAFAAGCP